AGGTSRPLFIRPGNVTLHDLTSANGAAVGGTGGCGGAGAGLGGGLFVYGGNVAIERVSFTNNQAIGGANNNFSSYGGGGLYGYGYSGGGGLFASNRGGNIGAYGGSGQYGGGGGVASTDPLDPGGDGDFGGGGSFDNGSLSSAIAGDGGFGGGGGFARGFSFGVFGFGGNGGFGGGGGSARGDEGFGGTGGYGGGGGSGYGYSPTEGSGAQGGFGGGDGSLEVVESISGLGGAGAGFGGAVFVRSGSVIFESVDFSGNGALPGDNFGGGINEAEGRGGAIFVVNRTQSQYSSEGFGDGAGLPSVLPTVEARDVTFSGNTASDGVGNTGTDGVAANQNNNDVYGTIAQAALLEAPVLANLEGQVSYTDNALALVAQILDCDVSVTDVDSANFDGGFVEVGYVDGGFAEDQLGVQNGGTGAEQISVAGSTVSFRGVAIGIISASDSGANGAALVVDLNSAATPTAVEALVENLTFTNTNLSDPEPSRTLGIIISDGVSESTEREIQVVVNNTLPDIAVFSGGLTFDGEEIPLALDSTAFGETFERSLRISNRGDDILTLGGVTVPEGFGLRRTDGSEITSGPLFDSLDPNQNLDLILERTDPQVTSFEEELIFTSNDPDQPEFVIPLTGAITFETQDPLEVDFTLTRLTLPPIELGEMAVRLDPEEVQSTPPEPGDVDETRVGTEDRDVLLGLGGNDNLIGLGDDDFLNGNQGDALLEGGEGNDRLFGSGGSDRIIGGAGNDIARGNSEGDIIDGGSGSDLLLGDGGDDFIDGADGEDLLRGGDGNDSLGGGLDDDFLLGEAGADILAGEDGDDFLQGGDGNDQLDGGLDDDLLNGGAGNDVLFGNDGEDRLLGGDGNDTLDGGLGLDTLTGGLGADTFAVDIDFLLDDASEIDVITDFENGTDLIAITGLAPVDTLTWNNGSNGVEVFVNGSQILQINGINSSVFSPSDFVT
ncbi:MAG: calcium-binding protein, partial [Cyanophyceae cyanobacterium]